MASLLTRIDENIKRHSDDIEEFCRRTKPEQGDRKKCVIPEQILNQLFKSFFIKSKLETGKGRY